MTNSPYKDRQNLNVAAMQNRMRNLVPISAPSLPTIYVPSVPAPPAMAAPTMGPPIGSINQRLSPQAISKLPTVDTSSNPPLLGYNVGRSGGAISAPSAPPLSSFGSGPIQNLIAKKATSYGVDPALALGIAKAESSFNPKAKNKASSAAGIFQLIDSAWDKYGGKGSKLDPEANTDAAMRMLRDNQRYLVGRGVAPTPEAVYLAHFLGPNGAVRVLQNPKDDVAKHLSKGAVDANDLQGKTGRDMLEWARSKIGFSPSKNYAGP